MNTVRQVLPNEIPGAAHLADGWLLTLEFSTTGGAHYETRVDDEGNTVRQSKKIQYDDMDLQKGCVKLINSAYATVRKHCAPLFAGTYFCPLSDLATLDSALQEGRERARVYNKMAHNLRSNRETRIEIFPSRITPDPRHALRAGQSLHWHLTKFRSTWESDYTNDYLMAMRDTQNLYMIVIGDQRTAILNALRSAEAQRENMLQYTTRDGRGVKSRERRGTPPKLNYSEIDAAIALFAPAEKAFL